MVFLNFEKFLFTLKIYKGINNTNCHKNTSLHIAVQKGADISTLHYLIAHGANIHLKNVHNKLPLDIAKKYLNRPDVIALLSRDTVVDVVADYKRSVIEAELASSDRYDSQLKALLKSDFDYQCIVKNKHELLQYLCILTEFKAKIKAGYVYRV